MQFINLEVVVAVLLFVGIIAFITLIYASMRALIAQAADTIASIIGHASNIFHSSRPPLSDANRPPPSAAPSEKPNVQDKIWFLVVWVVGDVSCVRLDYRGEEAEGGVSKELVRRSA
jgi:hypothetical protein